MKNTEELKSLNNDMEMLTSEELDQVNGGVVLIVVADINTDTCKGFMG